MKHNLDVGDYFYLYNTTNTYTNKGIHLVKKLGDDVGDNISKVLITETEIDNNITLSQNGFLIKIINPSESDITYENPKTVNSVIGNISGGTKIVDSGGNVRTHDFVEMRSSVGVLNGIFKVLTVVDDGFVIDVLGIESNNNPINTTFRVLDGTPSEYYIREYEVISTNDYETYETGFSSNIFPNTLKNSLGVANRTYSFQFNKDVNTTNLTSNRGGKITELYLGFIKRSGQNTYDWSNVGSQWEDNIKPNQNVTPLETISVRTPGGVGSVEKLNYGDKYIGDFVEFNRLNLNENIISEIVHFFRPNNNPSNNYYYKPFKKLQIRVYSDNIETVTTEETVINLPGDVVPYPNGDLVWKDILSVGFYENGVGVDYPFINNSHYIHSNTYLYIRVQTPNRPKLMLETVKISEFEC